jgi:excisionase family DNA binding protein
MNETKNEVLTVHDIAEVLRVSTSTAYRLCRDAEFPAFRVGGQIRVTRKDLYAWIARRLGFPTDWGSS